MCLTAKPTFEWTLSTVQIGAGGDRWSGVVMAVMSVSLGGKWTVVRLRCAEL